MLSANDNSKYPFDFLSKIPSAASSTVSILAQDFFLLGFVTSVSYKILIACKPHMNKNAIKLIFQIPT